MGSVPVYELSNNNKDSFINQWKSLLNNLNNQISSIPWPFTISIENCIPSSFMSCPPSPWSRWGLKWLQIIKEYRLSSASIVSRSIYIRIFWYMFRMKKIGLLETFIFTVITRSFTQIFWTISEVYCRWTNMTIHQVSDLVVSELQPIRQYFLSIQISWRMEQLNCICSFVPCTKSMKIFCLSSSFTKY